MPRPPYRFAMLTTRRRFASASSFCILVAFFHPFRQFNLALHLKSGTFPISFKYMNRIFSPPPSGTEGRYSPYRLLLPSAIILTNIYIIVRISRDRKTSILCPSKYSKTFPSVRRLIPCPQKSHSLLNIKYTFFFFPRATARSFFQKFLCILFHVSILPDLCAYADHADILSLIYRNMQLPQFLKLPLFFH